MTRITEIKARACVIRGDDIDTDRIIPARFMKVITFDDMGLHCFEDDRKAAKGLHPLEDERFKGAGILIVGKNFGCGSSREHAPQSLMRFGFSAFVGESFAEIFAGNCTSLGLVCLTLGSDEIETLRESIELEPDQEVQIDVAQATISARTGRLQGEIPAGTRDQLLEGRWDSTSVLLEAGEAIEQTASGIGYIRGY
ncbi:MAG: isopropylmalate isomerase [Deltaproteobacteria bacterium]|nr:isopropylmalate isomerase [Deltaproteobacteria bacterium]